MTCEDNTELQKPSQAMQWLGGLMLDSDFPGFPQFYGREGWEEPGCTYLLPRIRQAAEARV